VPLVLPIHILPTKDGWSINFFELELVAEPTTLPALWDKEWDLFIKASKATPKASAGSESMAR
jgi:hypothetical protein